MTCGYARTNYSASGLKKLLGSVGEDVQIHHSVTFFSPERIRLGSNVRIDCQAVLSAGPQGICIGDYVHLAAGVYLFGSGGRIEIASFCGLSARVSVYTASDDYAGGFLTNPTVPAEFKNVQNGDVLLGKHALVGAGSVIMPGVVLGTGASIGGLSLVTKSVPEFVIAVGNPLRFIGERPRSILDLEREFLAESADYV